ncbi:MAG: hypothetical protein ACP6IP_03415 [Candidatus Njordarchaeia archaeon]
MWKANHFYNFAIKGLDGYKKNRPLYAPREIEDICNNRNTVEIAEKAYIRNRVLEILENQAVGRFHTKLAKIILGSTRNRYTIYEEGMLHIRDSGETFERVREFFYEISQTPPEFSAEALNDPLERRKIEKYLAVKNRMVYYPIPLLLYIFEHIADKKVKFVFARDLVGGEPAHEAGLPGGRDIDYFVVVEGNINEKLKEFARKVEAYLDNLFGSAIINYMFKETALSNLQIEEVFKRPYNEIIDHNIIEVHLISFEEVKNYVQISYKREEGFIEIEKGKSRGLFGKPLSPDVKLFEMTKYRLRINSAIEKVLEDLGIPIDQSKTFTEFRSRLQTAIFEKKVKFKLIKTDTDVD